MSIDWERRRRRAEELEALWPASAEILRFYRGVLDVQRGAASPEELLGDVRRLAPAAEAAVERALEEGRPHEGPCVPRAAVLREDAEAGALRRTLLCGLCGSEAPHARVACPACGEEDPAKLPRFTAREIPWIRIDACDACRSYLKAVDLTKAPEAEPFVDELASLALDVVARDKGYRKLSPNLAGL
jgi:formate dehydrogenase maturation protein FdhE